MNRNKNIIFLLIFLISSVIFFELYNDKYPPVSTIDSDIVHLKNNYEEKSENGLEEKVVMMGGIKLSKLKETKDSILFEKNKYIKNAEDVLSRYEIYNNEH